MPLVHNRINATRLLKLILATKGREAVVGFGCGRFTSNVPLLHVKRTKSPGGLGSALKDSEWKGDITPRGKPAPSIVATGFLQLDGETLIIRCRGNLGQVPRLLREYFVRGFKLKLAWSSISIREQTDADASLAEALPDEEEAVRAISEEALLQAQDDAYRGEDYEDAIVTEVPRSEEETAAISPEQAVPESTAKTFATDKTLAPVEEDEQDNGEEMSEEASASEPAGNIEPRLAAEVSNQAALISAHMLQLALQVGIVVGADGKEVAGRISDWLQHAVAAVPPEEQEIRLYNLSVRLLLMLSYTDALQTQVTEGSREKKKKKSLGAPRSSAVKDAGTKREIQLAAIPDTPMTGEELTDILYREAVALAEQDMFPFDLTGCSQTMLRNFVSRNWQEGLTGAALIRQAEAVRKTMQGILRGAKGVPGVLGLQPSAKQAPHEMLTALADRVATRWTAMHQEALAELELFKQAAEAMLDAVDPSYSVERLGGSWNDAEDAVAQLESTAFGRIMARIAANTGEEREAAVAAAEAMVSACLSQVESSTMLRLLDEAPIGAGTDLRGPAIAALGQISVMLANLRSAA
jgi:hypothetical protein